RRDGRDHRRRALPAPVGRPVNDVLGALASTYMARALRILYVMDPLARILVDKDTTFAFMLEGQSRGHEQHHCGIEDLFVERGVPHARVRFVSVRRAD